MANKKLKASKSYEKFEKVIQRSLDLISLQKILEGKISSAKKKKMNLSDISRAAIVLSIAAMDSYFTNIFAERCIPYLRKKGKNKNITKFLEKAGFDVEVALELLSMDRPYRRIRKLIELYLEQHTTQRTKVIDELFLAYNLKNFSNNVQMLKKRKNLLRTIELLVERRNKIAHEGDLNLYGRLNKVDLGKIRRRIEDVVKYVSGADEILQLQLAK